MPPPPGGPRGPQPTKHGLGGGRKGGGGGGGGISTLPPPFAAHVGKRILAITPRLGLRPSGALIHILLLRCDPRSCLDCKAQEVACAFGGHSDFVSPPTSESEPRKLANRYDFIAAGPLVLQASERALCFNRLLCAKKQKMIREWFQIQNTPHTHTHTHTDRNTTPLISIATGNLVPLLTTLILYICLGTLHVCRCRFISAAETV